MKYSPVVLMCMVVLFNAFTHKPGKNLRIIFIGDSITEGSAMANPEKDAPGVYAASILRKAGGIASVEPANLGFSGYTTVDFLPVTNTVFSKVLEAAEKSGAAGNELVFSIMLGTNDSAIEGPNGSPVSAQDYKQNLQAIINELLRKFPAAKFVLQYPIWYSPNTHNGARYLQQGLSRLESYYPQLDTLALEYAASHPKQVIAGSKKGFDLFMQKKEILLIPEKGNSGIFYLHPNEKGSEELAKIWATGLSEAVFGK